MKIRLALLTGALLVVVVTAARADTVAVAMSGTVSGQPESVSFAGNASVTSRLAPDPDFGKPRLVLTIDLTGISGVGAQSAAKYVVYGPEIVQRGLAATHSVQVTFPFKAYASPDTVLARSGLASFSLTFDLSTGAITGATGSVTSLSR